MTVSSTSSKAGPYTGNDSASSFAFSFKVFADTDIRVVETVIATDVETDLTLDSNYTVTRNSNQDDNPGGSITYKVGGVTAALPSTKKLTIVGDLPFEQTTDIPRGGSFPASSIENALDRLTLLLKQLKVETDRSVKTDISSATTPDELLSEIDDAVDLATSSATAASASATSAAASATAAASALQFVASGLTPTYISTTSFSLSGDQTGEFHQGRRLACTATGGTKYGTVSASVYNGSTLTTVTLTMDTGQTLNSGLSAVSYSVLRADNSAVPGNLAKKVTITSSGSWTVPAGVNTLYLSMCGGGGGGGGSGGCSTGTMNASGGGGGGGGADFKLKKPVTISPGQVLTVTIGAAGTGGAGGVLNGVAGVTGGATSVTGTGVSESVNGGDGGQQSAGSSAGGISSGGAGGNHGANAGSAGLLTTASNAGGAGGFGGGGPFGMGSTRATGSGVGRGFGTGGAGGAGIAGTSSTSGNAGSSGFPGVVYIEY